MASAPMRPEGSHYNEWLSECCANVNTLSVIFAPRLTNNRQRLNSPATHGSALHGPAEEGNYTATELSCHMQRRGPVLSLQRHIRTLRFQKSDHVLYLSISVGILQEVETLTSMLARVA